MIDRFGKQIRVAWADHEILWIKAAIRMPRDERIEAFQDIASLTGRTEFQVRAKARDIRAKQRADAEILANLRAYPRKIMVPGPAPHGRVQISWTPDKAKLMGCR